MFQSEQLQEKWAPLLDYEGLDPIKDNHRRAVTSVLLENQEKFLKEEQAFSSGINLMEAGPTNSGNAVGAQGGFGTDGGVTPTAGFDPVLISLIRRAMPNLVAYDLAGVQPMSGPTGLIFAMRSRFTSQTGTEALFNEADTAFSGTDANSDTTLTRAFSDVNTGIGTVTQQGVNPAALNPVGTAQTNPVTYATGQGMPTGDAESLDGTGNDLSLIHI